jgi:uncharacterized membrane protein
VNARPTRAKEPVSAVLAGPYGHPFHPILVTVPIGAWAASLVFDVASHLLHEPGALVVGSAWLIGIGVVGAVLAALVGFLDLLAIPAGTRAFRTGLVHMSLNLAVTAAYAVGFWWRTTGSTVSVLAGPGSVGPVAIGPLLLSGTSFAVLALSGTLGGRLAYRYGVRVVDESTQAEGFEVVAADVRSHFAAGRVGRQGSGSQGSGG